MQPLAESLDCGAIPLADHATTALLRDVLNRAQQVGNAGIVVFDLDSTLLDNRPRQARIMREYGGLKQLEPLLDCRPEHWEGWDSAIAMANAGLEAEQISAHIEEFRVFWRDRFFTSEYCADDVPIPGAVAFSRAVLQQGAQLAYVTGRHEGMRPGTIASFRRPGFPIPDAKRVLLLMKPKLEHDDDEYKRSTFTRLGNRGELIAAFDNEPTHINDYNRAFPSAISVHLATDHSPRSVLLAPGIPSIWNFLPFRPL